MGGIVSFLEQRQTTPTQSNNQTDTTSISGPSCPSGSSQNPSPRPSHISFPSFGTLALSPTSSPSQRENPFERPLLSPTLTFYTAPSTPLTSPRDDDPPSDPTDSPTQPEVVLLVPPPPTPPSEAPAVNRPEETDISPSQDDAFPNVEQVQVDPFLDDEGLSSLEKIYLFSRSQATFHRVFITHSLSAFMDEITPSEAVEYVLPLLSGLAMDPEEQVKEALAAELVPIIWWFFTHCLVVEDDDTLTNSWTIDSQPNIISVQAFTPILGTLLLSPQVNIGGPARYAIVELLTRMRKADEREEHMAGLGEGETKPDETEEVNPTGLFGRIERRLFRDEVLQQVIIGIGRLDVPDEDEEQGQIHREWNDHSELEPEEHAQQTGLGDSTSRMNDIVNPYFPPVPLSWPDSLEAQASSTHAPPSASTSFVPTAKPSGYADMEAPLHVSFAQLPVAPSPMASYQAENHPVLMPAWLSSSSHVSPPVNSDPPPVRQPVPYHPENGVHDSYHGEEAEDMNPEDHIDGEEDEQAAVGRLSSMSLMAAVAASGPLEEDTQMAFVKEIERVAKDPVYWVRREASFALGALAKIVPAEVVVLSLLPVFESLRHDTVTHVRHSALFALPAILSRLTPAERRCLALDTIVPLSTDEAASVRLGVLEALGEVLYTFHEDKDGPPGEILKLFLGREEDHRARDEQHQQQSSPLLTEQPPKQSMWGAPNSPFASHAQDLDTTASFEESPLEAFYKNPERPLICAFNYPAVALTLGRARWGELRDLYISLSQDPAIKVRRTLAASLGELAKIIGPVNAKKDLLPVWWNAIRFEEDGEVRLKAIECLETFVGALDTKWSREEVTEGLSRVWREDNLKGWRERRLAVCSIVGLTESIGQKRPKVVGELLKLGLEDGVAGVREAAISIIPQVWKTFEHQQSVLEDIRADIRSLCRSPAFRSRMTFIACQQALTVPGVEDKHAILADATFWDDLSTLVHDEIIGVRITLARFASFLHDQFSGNSPFPAPLALQNLMSRLSEDASQEVRSFVARRQTLQRQSSTGVPSKRSEIVSIFSRPPQPETCA